MEGNLQGPSNSARNTTNSKSSSSTRYCPVIYVGQLVTILCKTTHDAQLQLVIQPARGLPLQSLIWCQLAARSKPWRQMPVASTCKYQGARIWCWLRPVQDSGDDNSVRHSGCMHTK